MYSNTHLGGPHDTSWNAVFKHQDDANTQAHEKLAPKKSADGQFTENIIEARHEPSKVSLTAATRTFSSAITPLASESSSQKAQSQLDLDYTSQAFDEESMNSFKRHGRAILTVAQVQAIFRYKSASFAKDSEKAGALARMYGVCVKTVRDIWGGRTWYRATFHLDQSKPFTPERLQKKAGRPKGAKDRKPRARKITFDGTCVDELHCRLESRCSSPTPCEGAESSDWTNFPTGNVAAAAFEDPFQEDWNQWLREDREAAWEPELESPVASDDED